VSVDFFVADEQGSYLSKPLKAVLFSWALPRVSRGSGKMMPSEGMRTWLSILFGIAPTGF